MKKNRTVFLILLIPYSCASQVFSSSKLRNVFALIEIVDSISHGRSIIDTVLIDKSDTTVYADFQLKGHAATCVIRTGDIVLYSLNYRRNCMKLLFGGNIYKLYFYPGNSKLKEAKVRNDAMKSCVSYTSDLLLKSIDFESDEGDVAGSAMKFGYKEVYERLLPLIPVSILN